MDSFDWFLYIAVFQTENAAKKQQTKMKSVLKLDKNFHIYIHGDESRIRRGVDPETGMKFYQFYYDEEE